MKYARVLLLAVTLGTAVTIDALDFACGRRIAGVNEECAGSQGSCKWRVVARDVAGNRLRDLALFPGLLVYPLAPLTAVLFAVASARTTSVGWRILHALAALAALFALARFVWLGVFTAVTW